MIIKKNEYQFRCIMRYLEPNKCQKLLNEISKHTLSVSMENYQFSEETKKILTEDLTTLVEENIKFYYQNEIQKKLHKKYINELKDLNFNEINIVIDKINRSCGCFQFEYRICTGKSQFITDDINLIKTITINDDY